MCWTYTDTPSSTPSPSMRGILANDLFLWSFFWTLGKEQHEALYRPSMQKWQLLISIKLTSSTKENPTTRKSMSKLVMQPSFRSVGQKAAGWHGSEAWGIVSSNVPLLCKVSFIFSFWSTSFRHILHVAGSSFPTHDSTTYFTACIITH